VILFWLVLLPLAGGMLLIMLRRWPIIVVPLVAAILMAMAILAQSVSQAESTFFMGRLVVLLPFQAMVLSFCYLLGIVLVLAGYRLAYGSGVYPLTLFFMSAIAACMAIQDATLAALLLEVAIIIGILVMATYAPDATFTSSRVLSVLVLLGPLLLMATWALAGRSVDPNDQSLVRLGGASLVLAMAIGFGVMPVGFWLIPVIKNGNPLAIFFLGFVLQVVLISRLSSVFGISLWPGGQQFLFSLLILGGLITTISAGFFAALQTSVGGILAYTLVADMGVVLIGIGLGTDNLLRVALVHLVYRGIAIVGTGTGLSILHTCYGGDHLDQVKGSWQRSPLAVIGLLLAACSLMGLPLSAGFTTRLSIIGSLGTSRLVWAALVIAASLGPAFAWGRFAFKAFSPRISESRQEPLVPALMTLFIGLLLLALGCYPRIVELLPQAWIQSLMNIVLPLAH
jgi:formate hydrogenlyase subunit 3/multisubunit Na+/H+ antiporter MnhD subunit